MKKLIEEIKNDPERAKIIFGEDIEAAYQAANAIVPCDKAEFEKFYNEQRAKSVAIIKVLKKAVADEKFAKIIYGENRKAAYEAAQTVSTGYTAEEFENVYKAVAAAALKTLHKDGEQLTDEELDMVTGGAGFKSWFKAVGGIVIGVGAAATAICTANPALAGVAIVATAEGVKGIVEIVSD